jgi:riboflavin synthase
LFTGVVAGMAKVSAVSKAGKRGADVELRIQLGKLGRGLRVGDSVSINGACLTVTRLSKASANFELVGETIRRTNLGSLAPGDKVNIERSLKVGDALEGHFVLGHIDGTGTIEDIIKSDIETTLWIRIDTPELVSEIVGKGSIAIDGVSLTVVDINKDKVSVSLIPHTLGITTLGMKRKGDKVNIETDILGKYITRNSPSHVG